MLLGIKYYIRPGIKKIYPFLVIDDTYSKTEYTFTGLEQVLLGKDSGAAAM